MVELLVALSVAGMATAAALAVTLSSRQFYDYDRQRTALNQNLRGALDIIGVDLRQAGERLPPDVPAILIANGDDGSPDTLIVRRNLGDTVLPLCESITPGATMDQVRVADSGGAAAQGCAPVADADGDGWPDNIGEWREFRDGQGGAAWGYVFNPVTRNGEFFLYDADGVSSDYLHNGNSLNWQHGYPVEQQCRVYLLEQRSYRLTGDVLQFLLNADGVNPLNIADRITDFQARAFLTDGSILDTLDETGSWAELQAIEVTLSGTMSVDGRTIPRSVSARFFPRNILSL